MPSLPGDARYALRNLLNARGFAAVAIATLALGIGAPVAMFTVVNALLLRPLPFRDADRLMALGEYDVRSRLPEAPLGTFSWPDFADVRSANRSFERLAAYHDHEYTVTGIGQALHVDAEVVSASLFPLLGVQPSLGRSFRDEEDQPGHHVVILSEAFWRAHFNSDPGVLGKTISLGGRPFSIVGVMPRGFQFPIRADRRDIWATFSQNAESDPDDPGGKPATAMRGMHWIEVLGRLRPGVTRERANADLASIARTLSVNYPNTDSNRGIGARPEIDDLLGDTRKPLLVLFGAVGLVLLIACANVANLLLGRATGRSREIAIRAALGARRLRIVRQFIVESLLLALAGAALGVGFADWAIAAVLRLYPTNLPRAEQIGIDLPVLLFTAALAIVTALLFGLLPSLRASSPDLAGAMREGGRSATASRSHNRLRAGLVIAETALGITLLIGAGLLLRSFDRLSHAPLGFNPQRLLTANFDLSESRYNADRQNEFINRFVERVRALPGVTAAAGAIPLPLSDDHWSVSFNLLDHPVPEASQPNADFHVVVPGFFETMQVPLVRGRTFDRRDQRNSGPVMIVSQAFAKKYFPHEDPLGRRVEIGASEGEARKSYATRTIVGIVGDIRTSNLMQESRPTYYIPLPQLMFGPPSLVIRTAGDPRAIAPALRRVLASMDPEAPLFEVRSMDDYLALDLGRSRFQTVLLGLFAGIALLLTAIGLYGVIAHAVSQRTHEIGIRMALGASRSEVLRMVLERGMGLTLAGVTVGVLGAAALARLIEASLYQTPPRDPLTYVTVCAVLSAVALLACYVPALRATRVDPTVALRCE